MTARTNSVILPSTVKKTHRGCAPEIRRLKARYPEMTDSAIARRVGCDPANVNQVLKRFLGNRTESDLKAFQENKAEVYDSIQFRLLESLTDKKIRNSSALQTVTAVGILHDKAALTRGQATGINVVALLDVAEAIRAKRDGGSRTVDLDQKIPENAE